LFPASRFTSRRHFYLGCVTSGVLTASGVALTPRQVFAQSRDIVKMVSDEAAASPVTIFRLRGGVALLQGSGGNIAVLTTKNARLLVDAGLTVSRPQVMTALEALGPQPITHLVNTHWHFDHADGNEWVHHQGAIITAHVKTSKHLSSTQPVTDWDHIFRPSAQAAIPTDSFEGEKTLSIERNTIVLDSYGSAHTDGDISANIVEADILHCGDTFWNGHYPFIDYSTGGSLDGMIRAADHNLARSTNKTIIIPGHGHPISNRRQLLAYRDLLREAQDRIGRLKNRGLPLQEVIKARPTSAYDAQWGSFVVSPQLFTHLIYEGV
jgi:glyoxylase-like metal-dependent hydrolase (beta-lactamase superfamily II)